MLNIGTLMNKIETNIEKKPTTSPLVVPPKSIAEVTSPGDRGGYRKSTIFPWTLEIINDDEVFAKAFWIICIAINPGTKKVVKTCPNTGALSVPIARLKTYKKSK